VSGRKKGAAGRPPQDELTAQVVGYSTIERARTGVEDTMNDFLTGSNANLSTIVDRTLEIEFLDAGVEAFAFTFG
jgi:hypothetical protein